MGKLEGRSQSIVDHGSVRCAWRNAPYNRSLSENGAIAIKEKLEVR
ncbi:hypothetical protein [Nostoc sp.]